MDCEKYVFDSQEGLKYAANLYVNKKAAKDGLVLVFAHCTSAHKEQWEPTVETLFNLSNALRTRNHVRKAWCLDCYSHGDSALLNEAAFSQGRMISLEDYADMLFHFLSKELPSLDPNARVVAVGHSSSTSAWVLACKMFTRPLLSALVIIEPVLICYPDHEKIITLQKLRVSAVAKRRSIWNDYDELSNWMLKREPWNTWDPRIIDIHLKYGFRATNDGRVTPKCSVIQESHLYPHEPHFEAGNWFHNVCSMIPVHAIFSENAKYVPYKARNAICDVAAGRRLSSISIIPKTRHHAIQESPEAVGRSIYDCLFNENIPTRHTRL